MRLGITGHQDLPKHAIDWIEREIRSEISANLPLMGLSSLAKGADQLFARSVLDAGQKLEVVLPCRDYVDTFDVSDRDDYFALLARASSTVTLNFSQPSEQAFLAAGQYLASHVERLVAVWDGGPSRGVGGTADIVAFARKLGIVVAVIWPDPFPENGTS